MLPNPLWVTCHYTVSTSETEVRPHKGIRPLCVHNATQCAMGNMPFVTVSSNETEVRPHKGIRPLCVHNATQCAMGGMPVHSLYQ